VNVYGWTKKLDHRGSMVTIFRVFAIIEVSDIADTPV
jgi:hypothetical protein